MHDRYPPLTKRYLITLSIIPPKNSCSLCRYKDSLESRRNFGKRELSDFFEKIMGEKKKFVPRG